MSTIIDVHHYETRYRHQTPMTEQHSAGKSLRDFKEEGHIFQVGTS